MGHMTLASTDFGLREVKLIEISRTFDGQNNGNE